MDIDELDGFEIFDMCANKSLTEIENMTDSELQKEALRYYFSRYLMNNDENNIFQCSIPIEMEGYIGGMSTNDLPCVDKIYQQSCEGIIYIHVYGCDENDWIDFDYCSNNELIQIAKEL